MANSGNVLHPEPPLSPAFSTHRILSRCSVLWHGPGLGRWLPRMGLRMPSPSGLLTPVLLARPFCSSSPFFSSPLSPLSLPFPLSPSSFPSPQTSVQTEIQIPLIELLEKWGFDLHLEGPVFQGSLFLSSASPMVGRVAS